MFHHNGHRNKVTDKWTSSFFACQRCRRVMRPKNSRKTRYSKSGVVKLFGFLFFRCRHWNHSAAFLHFLRSFSCWLSRCVQPSGFWGFSVDSLRAHKHSSRSHRTGNEHTKKQKVFSTHAKYISWSQMQAATGEKNWMSGWYNWWTFFLSVCVCVCFRFNDEWSGSTFLWRCGQWFYPFK